MVGPLISYAWLVSPRSIVATKWPQKMAAYKWGTPIRTTFWFTVPWFYRHWWCRDRAPRLVKFCIEKIPKSGYRGTNGTIGIDLPILGWLDKMLGSTVPAVVDVVPVLGRFLE